MARVENPQLRVMIVSSSDKFRDYFLALLDSGRYAPIVNCTDAAEARRSLLSAPADLVIINTPLPDEFGTQLALNLAADKFSGILLFARAEMYDQLVSQTRDSGVFVLARPTPRALITQALDLLNAARDKFRYYQQRSITLESRMEEIRLINRAKLILISRLNMSEPEAHRYIEKTAMDRSLRKRDVAETIIRTYDN